MDQAEFYLNIINQLQDGIYYVDTDRRIRFWNRAAEEITGYSAEEIVGKQCPDSGLNHIDGEGHPLCKVGCPLYATLADGKTRKEQVFVHRKDGSRLPIRITVFPVRDNGTIIGAVETFTREPLTTASCDLVEHLANVAMHDTLTKLPNRRYMESFLSYRLQEYQRFGRSFAVLFADIDDFSKVNNTYGHDAGDAVLRNIANSMLCSVRSSDLIGRWGGEEFVGVCSINKASECRLIGERFRAMVEHTESYSDGHLIRATVSVGITAIAPQDSAESVVERADHLMYRSKKSGKNCCTTDVCD